MAHDNSDWDRLAADLFLLELELQDWHPDVGLAVYGMQHYGMSPCELSHLAVEVFGSIDPGSAAAWVRRKALRAEARGIFEALGYRIAATPGRDVFDISPAREPLSAHDRVARLAGFRARLGRGGGRMTRPANFFRPSRFAPAAGANVDCERDGRPPDTEPPERGRRNRRALMSASLTDLVTNALAAARAAREALCHLPALPPGLWRLKAGVERRAGDGDMFDEAALAEIAALLRGLRTERDAEQRWTQAVGEAWPSPELTERGRGLDAGVVALARLHDAAAAVVDARRAQALAAGFATRGAENEFRP